MVELSPLRFETDPKLDEELRERLLGIWADVTNAGGAVGFVPPVTPHDVRAIADGHFEKVDNGEARLIVAYRDDRPVGFGFLIQRAGPLFAHWATIKNLQIHPDAQTTGAGAALLAAVEASARDSGLEQLHLTVRGRTGIESFYLRHGYEIVARIPDLIRLGPGADREEIYLRKLL